MKGYLWSRLATPPGPRARPSPQGAPEWEQVAVDAVGNAIEFWGFKRNQGRVWALLYLRDAALTAAELEKELDLSKGAVSMLIRDLERWGVVSRVRGHSDASWRYQAETNLAKMVRQVVEEREYAFISRIHADLTHARKLAEASKQATPQQLQRLATMEKLAETTQKALKVFLRTSRLDVTYLLDAFRLGR